MRPRRAALTTAGDDRPLTRRPGRLTPAGGVILGLLAASVVALLVGSRTLQSLGAVAIVLILLFFVAAKRPGNRNL